MVPETKRVARTANGVDLEDALRSSFNKVFEVSEGEPLPAAFLTLLGRLDKAIVTTPTPSGEKIGCLA